MASTSDVLVLSVGLGGVVVVGSVGRGAGTACGVTVVTVLVGSVQTTETLFNVTSMSNNAVLGLDPGGLPGSSVSYGCHTEDAGLSVWNAGGPWRRGPEEVETPRVQAPVE